MAAFWQPISTPGRQNRLRPRAEPAVDSPTKAAATTRTATPPEATEEAQAGTYLAEPVSGFRKGALVSHVNFLAARSGFA